MSDFLKRLEQIREGAIEDPDLDTDDLKDDEDDDEIIELLDDDIDEEILSEVTLSIIEAEVGPENLQAFITENAAMLERDKILTPGTIGKSYIVLSPAARRRRAINILKLKMARDSGDPRYKKLVVARKLAKSLLMKIRNDGKYKKAEAIIKKMRFKIVRNPEAVAAMKKASKVKLQ
jgi:hypothetical protein